GDLLDHPLGLGIQARDALAGIGVLDVAQPVPDEPADIELVVEDAGAAGGIAVDGRRSPAAALWTKDAFGIEVEGDATGRLADGIFIKDPRDDRRLGLVDLTSPGGYLTMSIDLAQHVIAIAEAATRAALLDPAAQAAAGLGREVLEEKRIHGALEADMQLADL